MPNPLNRENGLGSEGGSFLARALWLLTALQSLDLR
jgi:hypothetical protein